RAVPPPPSTAMVGASCAPAERSASTIPGASVFSAYQPPPRGTSVLAAPSAPATGDTAVATRTATSLSGIVSDRPAHVPSKPATNPASSDSAHSTAVYSQPVNPAAA